MKYKEKDIKVRYRRFVKNFLITEDGVNKVEMFKDIWNVTIERKMISVIITLESKHNEQYDFDEWFAVISQKGKDEIHYPLYREEVKHWIEGQRRIKMWEKFNEK
jgi:hypothetical protein